MRDDDEGAPAPDGSRPLERRLATEADYPTNEHAYGFHVRRGLSQTSRSPTGSGRRAASILLTAIVAVLLGACSAHEREELRDGDIIFQTSRSAQSLAIQRATGSPYSHMGLVVFRDAKPFVLEASATVVFTPLQTWIDRGEGRRYVVKRLRGAAGRLTPDVLRKARAVARRLQGKRYDLTFEWSDERMYCSELVWKIYKQALGVEVGALQRLREFRLDDAVVESKLRERYGREIPLDEPVISPGAMFASPELVTVLER